MFSKLPKCVISRLRYSIYVTASACISVKWFIVNKAVRLSCCIRKMFLVTQKSSFLHIESQRPKVCIHFFLSFFFAIITDRRRCAMLRMFRAQLSTTPFEWTWSSEITLFFSLSPVSEDKEKDLLFKINSCPKAVYHDPVARRFRRKLILRQVHTCLLSKFVGRREGGEGGGRKCTSSLYFA